MFDSKAILLTRNIITSCPETRTMGEILDSYDGPAFEKATTTYRKPSYQRAFAQTPDWERRLVESVLKGHTCGALILSEWTKLYKLGDVNAIERFFNVEDGQTRLTAFDNFRKGLFTTKYGSYKDVAAQFDSIKIPVIVQRKAHPRVPDKDYHKQLLQNFSDLQEGTSLSDSDRYFVWVQDLPNHVQGSPLVNATLNYTNNMFRDQFKEFMKLETIDNRSGHKARQPLTDAVALISACWKGPYYANKSYTKHVDILMESLSKQDEKRVTKFMQIIFATIKSNFDKFAKYKGEHIKQLFMGTRTYVGIMITDLFDQPDQNVVDFINKWSTLISIHRHIKKRDGPDSANDWMNTTVYEGLTHDQLTRFGSSEFRCKRDKVNEWWAAHLLNGNDYTYTEPESTEEDSGNNNTNSDESDSSESDSDEDE